MPRTSPFKRWLGRLIRLRLRGAILGWAAGLALLAPPVALAQEPAHLGLFIGNNRGVAEGEAELRYAEDDAVAAAAVFEMLHPEGQSWLLLGQGGLAQAPAGAHHLGEASRAGLAEAINQMAGVAAEARGGGSTDVVVFLHFSGHGERGGELNLVDGYHPLTQLHHALGALEPTLGVALLDGCYLGQGLKGEEAGDLPALFGPPLRRLPSWLAAVGATSRLPEEQEIAGGLLTLIGLSGLQGLADANDDGKVEFFEWERYIVEQVGRVDPQVAVATARSGEDPLAVLQELRGANAGSLRIAADVKSGWVQLRAEGATRPVAAFYHTQGRGRRISLPPGRFEIEWFGIARGLPDDPFEAMRLVVTIDAPRDERLVSAAYLEMTGQQLALYEPHRKGLGAGSSGQEVALLGERTAHWLRQIERSSGAQAAGIGRPPVPWRLAVGWVPAAMHGAVYTPNSTPGDVGGEVRISRHTPLARSLRWHLSGGPMVGYGRHVEPDVAPGSEGVSPGLSHRALVGGALAQEWLAPQLTFGLVQFAGWSPVWVSAPGGAAAAPPGGGAQAAFPMALSLGASAGVLWHLSRGWSVGPSVTAERIFFEGRGLGCCDQRSVQVVAQRRWYR